MNQSKGGRINPSPQAQGKDLGTKVPEKGVKHLLKQIRTLMTARQLEADKAETGELDEAEERQNLPLHAQSC